MTPPSIGLHAHKYAQYHKYGHQLLHDNPFGCFQSPINTNFIFFYNFIRIFCCNLSVAVTPMLLYRIFRSNGYPITTRSVTGSIVSPNLSKSPIHLSLFVFLFGIINLKNGVKASKALILFQLHDIHKKYLHIMTRYSTPSSTCFFSLTLLNIKREHRIIHTPMNMRFNFSIKSSILSPSRSKHTYKLELQMENELFASSKFQIRKPTRFVRENNSTNFCTSSDPITS